MIIMASTKQAAMVFSKEKSGEAFLLKNSNKLSKKYPGYYIGVVGNKLVSVKKSSIETFRSAREKHPKGLVSVFYIPRKDELVTLL